MDNNQKLAELLMMTKGKQEPLTNDLVRRTPYNPINGAPADVMQQFAPQQKPYIQGQGAMLPGETFAQFQMRMQKENPIDTSKLLTY